MKLRADPGTGLEGEHESPGLKSSHVEKPRMVKALLGSCQPTSRLLKASGDGLTVALRNHLTLLARKERKLATNPLGCLNENLLGRFGAPYFLEPKHVSSLNCTTVYDNMRIGLHISTLLLAGGCLITRTATVGAWTRAIRI